VLRGALRASVSTFVQDATTLAGAVAVSRAGGPTRCATTRSLGYIPVVPCEPGCGMFVSLPAPAGPAIQRYAGKPCPAPGFDD
jgi:hypothetical protein